MDAMTFNRVRSVAPLDTINGQVGWSGPSPPAGQYSFLSVSPYRHGYHLISDNIGHKMSPARKSHFSDRVGRVYHLNIYTNGVTPLTGFYGSSTVSPWGYTFNGSIYPSMDKDSIVSLVPSISDADFYGYNLEAFNDFADAFPQELSFGEFAQGMFQLRQLMPKIEESIGKSFSGGFLNKTFGWDNLLSDLDILASLFSRISKRLEYLKDTYGILTRLSKYKPDLVGNIAIGSTVDWTWGNTITNRYTLLSYSLVYRAGAWLLQTLDYVDGVIGVLRALIGAFGLNNPVKAVWELLPFSFVVDWFFKISDHLDHLTRVQPTTGWRTFGPTCSVKQHAILKVQTKHVSGTWNNPWHDNGYVSVFVYRRFDHLPLNSIDLTPIDELSPMQLALLLALLHQQS